MPILIFQIFYVVVLLSMILMSLFIVYHIVAFSYSSIGKITMLAIFVPVACVLIATNVILFLSIDLNNLLSNIL